MTDNNAQGNAHESTIALMQQGRWKAAEQQLTEAIERNPGDVRALRLLGTLCHITKRSDEALSCLEHALELEPENVSTLQNLGSVYLDTGRIDSAERCFAQIIENDPSSADGHFNLGLAVQRNGRFDEAAKHYTCALERDPQALDAAINLTAVHLLRGDHEACISNAEKILQRDAAHLQARVLLLKALLALGQLVAAEQAMQQIPAAISDHHELRSIEGKVHLLNGRLEQAAQAYRRAQDLGDTSTATSLDLTRCLLDSGDAAGAIEVLRTIIEREPMVADHHALLGLALRDAGHDEAALAAYERALHLQPKAAHFVTAKATLLFNLERHEQAEQALNDAIELAPSIVSPYLLRVERLIADADLPGALATCEQYLDSHGAECNMLASKSFLLHAMGRSDQATALMDLEGLVSTTVIKPPNGFSDLQAFNAALCAHILQHPSLSRHNAASKATQHGRQSGNLLFADRGPFESFEKLLWNGAQHYVQALARDSNHPFRAAPPALDAVYAWAVVLERAGYQSPHIHPTAWLSGVYYPKVPAIVDEGHDEQGWIEFGVPPPELTLTPAAPTRRIKPQEGLLVLFRRTSITARCHTAAMKSGSVLPSISLRNKAETPEVQRQGDVFCLFRALPHRRPSERCDSRNHQPISPSGV